MHKERKKEEWGDQGFNSLRVKKKRFYLLYPISGREA